MHLLYLQVFEGLSERRRGGFLRLLRFYLIARDATCRQQCGKGAPLHDTW